MSFSHLSQARKSNFPLEQTDTYDPKSLGPGSYIAIPSWCDSDPNANRPKTVFGTSVEQEIPRHSHLDRDNEAIRTQAILTDHKTLLHRNRSPKKKKLEPSSSVENFHLRSMEPYTIKLPEILGDKLRQKRRSSKGSSDISDKVTI